MSEPLNLDAIRDRYNHYGPKITGGTAVGDVRALIDEVSRLRAELDAARVDADLATEQAMQGLLEDVAFWKAEAKAFEGERDAARAADKARRMGPVELGVPARAERTEPGRIVAPWTPEQVEALNEWQHGPTMHPFTCGGGGHTVSVVLVATEEGWQCPRSWCGYTQDWAHDFMARAERTEPATGEDVAGTPLDLETVGDALVTYVGGLGLDPTMIRPYGAADAILAALDLPGRVKALRIEWMKAVTQARDDEIDNLTAERDAAHAALAEALEKHERELYAAHERGWNDRDALLKVRMNDDD